MRALANSICITGWDKLLFKVWRRDIAKRMMDDAVVKWRGRDQSFLRFMNMKTAVLARLISFVLQLVLQLNQVIGQQIFESSGRFSSTFTARGVTICQGKVFPLAELFL